MASPSFRLKVVKRVSSKRACKQSGGKIRRKPKSANRNCAFDRHCKATKLVNSSVQSLRFLSYSRDLGKNQEVSLTSA